MSNSFSSQLVKVQQRLTDPKTLSTYTQVVTVTFEILKETLLLLWLTVCLVLVLFDWLGTKAIALGRQSKDLASNLKAVNTDHLAADLASGTSKTILSAGKASLHYTIAQAREQLGLSQKTESSPEPASSANVEDTVSV
ncbi:MAG: hypothetical protein MUF49_27035 [Oculatellaceae cyanobacterium Prado106]|jgi:hypothetical protein|nr:hypothetical protein [Oculatellaceae cyanobacterium Prado106]